MPISWGGSYKLMPGVQGDIDRMAGLYGQVGDWGQNVGLGFVGKQAKHLLKGIGQGDFDSNPIVSNYFAPLRNQAAVADSELRRRAGMGVNAIAPGQQAGLLNAQQNLASNRVHQDSAMAMQAMVPQLYGQASNTFAQARGQRLGAEESAFSQQANIANSMNRARLSGMYKTGGLKGFLNDIGGIAGAVGGAMMGMPGIGGAGAAGSQLFKMPGVGSQISAGLGQIHF